MKVIKWLDEHFEEYILIVLSICTVIIVFTQVFMRYVLGESLTWSEEVARYLFIWMIYVGISYGVKKEKHLGVDAFPMLFEKKGKIIIDMIASFSFLMFAVIMTYYGFDIVLKVTRESAALELPLEWVYAAPVVGMILTSIRLIQKLVRLVNQLKVLNQTNRDQSEEQTVFKEEIL
ncbi:TRAP transporter small permease [Metabacillus niabensis]|uniref:TRAP-type C4-dicarboxylate transport system permease small subunit n=1 Tax=Metabacillus niabensis TaxID=324854 RepID=A0ABT9Z6B4_9BACI|nr:TRAP transporter small permease [Metabacillus niabensis]MDQ0227789.1 TRAP-type C4-dicarboxylate transport system permease small subunit [Metabacillus niabensis]